MKFEDIQFEKMGDGIRANVDLGNGYKLSIVSNKFSYGGEKGLYEIGVYHRDHKTGMVIPEGWSESVKGWLHPEGVEIEINGLEQDEAKFQKVNA